MYWADLQLSCEPVLLAEANGRRDGPKRRERKKKKVSAAKNPIVQRVPK